MPKLVLEACWRYVWYAIGLVGVGVMLFLCLRPSSDVHTLGLPHWAILDWAERHGEFRNFPAFFVLGLPFLVVIRHRSRRAIAMGLLAFAGMAVEIVQIWLPHRWASVMDVLWSWAGLAVVWAMMALLRWSVRRARARSRHHGDSASTRASKGARSKEQRASSQPARFRGGAA